MMSATSCMKTDGDDNIFFGGKVMSTTSCTKPDGDSDIFIICNTTTNNYAHTPSPVTS